MSGRGWSSAGLKTIGDDPDYWTADEASQLLGPPTLSKADVRNLVKIFNVQPYGKRRVTLAGRSGRHARVYSSQELIKAYDAIQRATEPT